MRSVRKDAKRENISLGELISLYIIDNGYSMRYPNVGHGITDYESYLVNSEEVRL